MIKEVINLQNEAVTKLYSKLENQAELTFKAPTGSGKTHMMADLMNRVLIDSSIVFIVSSLSKADLGKQNYEKFVEYGHEYPNINPYLINSNYTQEECVNIPDGYNVYVLPRDLYKKNSILKDSGALVNFLYTLRFYGKRLFLIKDECHQATNNLNDLNDLFERVINFSATPKFKPDVEITVDEAEETCLIKHEVPLSDFSSENFYSVNDEDDIEDAVKKFLKVKEKYSELMPGINPCLIIQISNKEKADVEWYNIKRIVNNPRYRLKWAYIVDESNNKGCETNDDIIKLPVGRWKDFIKDNSSLIDIIIFKMVITEGWDIPRACMLYQVRDSQSKQLDEQVIGRVKRNPILRAWENYDTNARQLALSCWIWGITEKNSRKFNKVYLRKRLAFDVKTTKINDISHKKDFNINEYITRHEVATNTKSIFELYKKWKSVSQETYDICWENVSSYSDWFNISNSIDTIDKKNSEYMSAYDTSLILDSTESFSDNSYYEISENNTEIDDWIWKTNNEDDEYSFDSVAEKEFAKVLKKLGTNKWGKNFYPNSKIKFEYMLYSKHASYPDFIVQDKHKNIHIFEVKSVNHSESVHVDNDSYMEKVDELCKMYKRASKISNQSFYIPINYSDKWKIIKYYDGKEEVMTMDEFKKYFKSIV